MSIFAELHVYHDESSRSAAMNMAIDEALLEFVNKPSLRFYRWDHPALSLGYFGRLADVENEPRDLVRRWTGGGIVLHGEDLTYALIIPRSDRAFGESAIAIYETVHSALSDVLISTGQLVELAPVATRNAQHSMFNARCFANPVRADVMSKGRKVAGAAQRRTRRGLLQQGSIQNIDLGDDFADRFARGLCRGYRQREVGESVIGRAREIASQKYGTADWLRRR
jgi:lipoate-protein ligase A